MIALSGAGKGKLLINLDMNEILGRRGINGGETNAI